MISRCFVNMNSTAALAPAHNVGFRVHITDNRRTVAHWKIGARRRSTLLIVSQDVSESEKTKNQTKKKKENSNNGNKTEDGDREMQQQQLPSSSVSVIKRLDDVNPVGLGRRSRQIFDEVWRKFSELGQISRTSRDDDENSLLIRDGGPMCEFAIPGAQNTTVLVVGATSRVGRIVVRKLMLRGYTVKVLYNLHVSSSRNSIFPIFSKIKMVKLAFKFQMKEKSVSRVQLFEFFFFFP